MNDNIEIKENLLEKIQNKEIYQQIIEKHVKNITHKSGYYNYQHYKDFIITKENCDDCQREYYEKWNKSLFCCQSCIIIRDQNLEIKKLKEKLAKFELNEKIETSSTKSVETATDYSLGWKLLDNKGIN